MKRLAAILVLAFSLYLPTLPAWASTYGSGTYGSCQYGGCSISLATSGNVNLDVTPTGNGSCTVQKDTVSVLSDNASGYTLSLSSDTSSTDLTSGANLIHTSSATFSTPSTLANNRWGYRVDNVGSFGAGPTAPAANATTPPTTFAGLVPSTSLADTLKSTNTVANPADTTDVWYGVCADTATITGSYVADVLYTAVAN